MKNPRITQQEWQTILTCLCMIDAGEWDQGSYGARPDFDTVIDKVQMRLKRLKRAKK